MEFAKSQISTLSRMRACRLFDMTSTALHPTYDLAVYAAFSSMLAFSAPFLLAFHLTSPLVFDLAFYQRFLLGFLSDIPGGILLASYVTFPLTLYLTLPTGIPFGILFEHFRWHSICNFAGILYLACYRPSAILSAIFAGILFDVFAGIHSGILFFFRWYSVRIFLSDIFGILSRIFAGIQSGILSLSDIFAGHILWHSIWLAFYLASCLKHFLSGGSGVAETRC